MMVLDVMARVSVVLLGAAAAYGLVSVRAFRFSARTRHQVLAFGLVAGFAAVVFSLSPRWEVLPSAALRAEAPSAERSSAVETVSLPGAGSASSTVASPAAAGASSRPTANRLPVSLNSALLLLWALGSLLLLVRLFVGERRLAALVSLSDPAPAEIVALHSELTRQRGVAERVEVRVGPMQSAILFQHVGQSRAVVLLPAALLAWDHSRLRLVLAHELAHYERRDPRWLRLALLLRALLFWNPVAWWLAARIRHEAELATDEEVVGRADVRASDYAEMLLRAAVGEARADAAFAVSSPAGLIRRVSEVLGEPRRRTVSGRTAAFLSVVSLAGAAFVGCAAFTDGVPAPVDHPAAVTDASSAAPPARASNESPTDAEVADLADTMVRAWTVRQGVRSARLVALEANTGRVVVAIQARRGEEPTQALDAVAPGSTLKPFVAAVALQEGFDPADLTPGGQQLALPGAAPVRDWTDHGPLDLPGILARSSNVGLAHVVLTLPGDRVRALLHEVGLNDAPSTIPAGLGEDDGPGVWAALGEGARIHPVALAAAYGAIANGGTWIRPTADGTGHRHVVLDEPIATSLQGMLRGVVEREDGTGRRAAEAGDVAGKTGTVQESDSRRALFVGWAEAEAGPVVVYVDMEVDGAPSDVYGGSVAAEGFVEVVRLVLRGDC